MPAQTNNSVKRIRDEQQNMLERFWKRWECEYLTSLLQQKKWLKEKIHFKIGQVVVKRDENLPPARWLIELIPSEDGN